MKFQVGDIVQCVNVDGDETATGGGSFSILTENDFDFEWPYLGVDFVDDMEVAYSASEIILVYRENNR